MLLRPSLLLVGLVACSRTESTATDAAAPPVVADAATDAGKPRDAGGDALSLSSKDRAKALKDLNEGRRLSRAKDWAGAIKAFERVLAVSPDDVHALSEIGWAALQANDLDRAEKANRRALANAKTPATRAPILYNMGRVAEARGNKEAAAKDYAASLALRDNAEVKKRASALDGGAPTGEPCMESFADTKALCACLLAHKDDTIMIICDAKDLSCKLVPMSLQMPTPRLGIVEWGADMLGEKAHYLTAKEGEKIRIVAELGRDYEPGAFGIHNSAEVKSAEKRPVNGHDLYVIRSEQHDSDSNMAGLEQCSREEKRETVCALGDAPGSTRCVVGIPVDVTTGCGVGVEPDESDLDDETKKQIADIKKNASTSHAKTTWSVATDGTLTVKLAEGDKALIDQNLWKPQRLW